MIKRRIKLTLSVECNIKANNEDELTEWMNTHTPQDIVNLSDSYNQYWKDEIVSVLNDNDSINLDISNDSCRICMGSDGKNDIPLCGNCSEPLHPAMKFCPSCKKNINWDINDYDKNNTFEKASWLYLNSLDYKPFIKSY